MSAGAPGDAAAGMSYFLGDPAAHAAPPPHPYPAWQQPPQSPPAAWQQPLPHAAPVAWAAPGAAAPAAAGGGAGAAQQWQQGYQSAVKDISAGKGGGSLSGAVLGGLFNVGVMVGVPLFFLYRMNRGGGLAGPQMSQMMERMNPVQRRNFRIDVKDTKFENVIGVPEAKDEVRQYVDFLKNPRKFTALGARLPKGALLTGRPGTGKTLLAKAVAGEAGVPFFSCSGADFIEIFGGSGPKRVRELFAEAKRQTPSVIFVDELDAVGQKRGGGGGEGGMGGEENRTTNALLAEMDGMGTDHDVIVLAATNHPESLDSALTRPGRFDRKIEIPIPDEAARTELFEYYLNRITTAANFEEKAADLRRKVDAQNEALEKKRAAPDAAAKCKELDGVRANIAKLEAAAEPGLNQLQVATRDGVLAKLRKQAEKLAGEVGDGEEKWEANLAAPAEADVAAARGLPRELAARTPGVTPASIATIANEAALVAADRGSSFVARADVEDAIDNVLIGKKHRARMSEHGLTRVAYHEAGHAVAQWLMGTQTPVIKVSIIPRGRAGGYTQFRQPEELDPRTDAFLFEQLVVALGGRCAEKLAFGDLSTGAQDDLRRAFDSAQGLVQTFGMSEEVGHIAVNPQGEQRGRAFSSVSEKLKSRIEDQGREIVDRAFERCMALLIENQDKMEALARRLIEKRELGEEEIAQILGPKVVAPQAVAGGQALLASRAAAA